MKVVIFFKSDKGGDNATLNYMTVDAQQWCVTNSCLAITVSSQTTRYYPLVNIESFSEVLEGAE